MNVAMLKLIVLPLFFAITLQSSPKPSLASPHDLINSITQYISSNETIGIPPQHYFEVTLPLLTDDITPSCSVDLLNYSFANTTGRGLSVSVNYTPPPSTCEWSIAVLEFRAESKGDQDDGVVGVWIDGVELLRTSTAQPTEDGVFWNVRKDVTRYSSIIASNNLTLTVMLDNRVNDDFTGVFNVNVSCLFYSPDADDGFPISFPSGESLAQAHSLNRKLISVKNNGSTDKLGLDRAINSIYPYDRPSDLIIPISGAPGEGFWFKIHGESDVRTTNVQISQKTYKAVLELYVSFHGDDELWYMNPPDSYIKANSLPTGRGKGAYREVLVTVDGKLVGSMIPFPVIFSGGINPLFWKPVASIGAFNMPTYDIDLTPFLGFLLDGGNHSIGIQIANGISYWLVDANLHIWVDHSNVQAIVEHEDPSVEIEHKCEFEGLDGEFETEIDRSTSVTGWVQSSLGILKTKVTQEIIFNNKLKIKDHGTQKQLDQTIKTKTKIKITDDKDHSVGKTVIENIYPLKITMQTGSSSSSCKDSSLMKTEVWQWRTESYSNEDSSISRVLNHDLNCVGSMQLKGNSVISGSTQNHQNYEYKSEGGCYSRKVDVVEGDVTVDQTTSNCG